MVLFVPNCLRKQACATGVSYSDYTITDYLTLCEGSIFAASSKLAPQEKTGYAALQHILFFPKWGSNNLHAANGTLAK